MATKPMAKLTALIAATAMALTLALPITAYADEQTGNASDNNRFYYSTRVNTGLDNGYSEANPITDDDPHFGWDLGKFVVSGYTSKSGDDSTPIFLKNAGDKVKLSFVLEQDIDALSGDESKKISDDKDGTDQRFEIARGEEGFGRGMLIVRHTDFQNATNGSTPYRDYLPALTVGAETEIELFEEGDYEAALDYEIQSPGLLPIRPSYNNYQIYFRFKVRNSNTMMFLFDTKTNDELFNGSVTPNGFRIDLAGSHYLDVSVKKEVMNSTGDGLTEDTRFNKTAADGAKFEDDGIYTIKVKNPSTGEEPTEKRIYVGTDDVMKASVANKMDIAEVKQRIDEGATVDDDGMFVQAGMKVDNVPQSQQDVDAEDDSSSSTQQEKRGLPIVPIAIGAVVLVALAALLFAKRGKNSSEQETTAEQDGHEEAAEENVAEPDKAPEGEGGVE